MLDLRVTLVSALLLASPPAQGFTTSRRPPQRFDLEATMQVLKQHVRDTADADRTVRRSSWLVLAFLAGGSTMRSGPYRSEVKLLAQWLRNSRTDAGWFAPGGERCSRGDQTLGALAVGDLCTLSLYPLLRPTWTSAAKLAGGAFERPDAAPASAEEIGLLAAMTAAVERDARERELTTQLRRLVNMQMASSVPGATRLADAAMEAARQQFGVPRPADLIAALAWPGDLTRDPLHAWFATTALMPHRDYLARYAASFDQLSAARLQVGGRATTWAPTAGFDEITTTAILVCVLRAAEASLPVPSDPQPK